MADMIYLRNKETGEVVPFPAGTSPEQMAAEMKRRSVPGAPSIKTSTGAEMPAARERVPPGERAGFFSSLGSGLADPYYGAKQLGANVEQFAFGGDLGDRVNKEIREREARLESEGVGGVGRFIGDALSPLNYVPGLGPLSRAGRIGRVAANTLRSTLPALYQPAENENYWTEKAVQGGVGYAGSRVLGALGRWARGGRTPEPAELIEHADTLQRELIQRTGRALPAQPQQTTWAGQGANRRQIPNDTPWGLPDLHNARDPVTGRRLTQREVQQISDRWDETLDMKLDARQAERNQATIGGTRGAASGLATDVLDFLGHRAGVPGIGRVAGLVHRWLDSPANSALRQESERLLSQWGFRPSVSSSIPGGLVLRMADRDIPIEVVSAILGNAVNREERPRYMITDPLHPAAPTLRDTPATAPSNFIP